MGVGEEKGRLSATEIWQTHRKVGTQSLRSSGPSGPKIAGLPVEAYRYQARPIVNPFSLFPPPFDPETGRKAIRMERRDRWKLAALERLASGLRWVWWWRASPRAVGV